MKKYLDYVPSWLDGATTLLDKINICIARVEQGAVTEETLQDVKELKEKVEALASYDVSLFSKISKNTSDIAKNTSDIAKNTSDITKKQDTLTAQTLESFVEGSDTVVVDLNESGDKINIHLENDVVNDIARSLKLPVNTPTETQVPVVLSNGSQAYENLSNIGGQSNKYYKHITTVASEGSVSAAFRFVTYSTYPDKYTLETFSKVVDGIIGISEGISDDQLYYFYKSEYFSDYNKIECEMFTLGGSKIVNEQLSYLLADYVTEIDL